ncbi:HesA/MoeB/ThiF family protein [Candidatus Woesearchaeota archaeon]|nr:HesA/MoeB/ThiF family protein [Candidatus Woesearchaeota archaeon]
MNKYIRQEILEEIGIEGQKRIRNAKIAIIGLGALGTVTSELLTRAGIGELLLFDKDIIIIENLHRQVLYKEKHVGKSKVEIAKKELNEINKDTKIKIIKEYLSKSNTKELDDYDLILDCTDNMASRFIINDYCQEKNKTWIHAAATGIKGNILVVDNPDKFKKIIRTGETFDNCNEIGVINTITMIVSATQVTQTIRIITEKKHSKELIRINTWNNEYDSYNIKN